MKNNTGLRCHPARSRIVSLLFILAICTATSGCSVGEMINAVVGIGSSLFGGGNDGDGGSSGGGGDCPDNMICFF